MDRRGGCCIARHATVGEYNMSKMERIMLRFRPIAPKASIAVGEVSGNTPLETIGVNHKNSRSKRRCAKDNKKCKETSQNKRFCSMQMKPTPENKVVTLSLLPEKPESRSHPAGRPPCEGIGRKMQQQVEGVVSVRNSWVRVESITDTWMSETGLGINDKEKVMNLVNDTCPGFISNGLNRVRWVNKEYQEMVGGRDQVMAVWLVMKEGMELPLTCRAFTCQVRVITCREGYNSKYNLVTLPCDVWKMDDGGFAWRLDIKAALCLGR